MTTAPWSSADCLGGRAGSDVGDIVPLVGARTRERLDEALPAIELNLTTNDLAEIEKAVPAGAARRPLPARVHVQVRCGELSSASGGHLPCVHRSAAPTAARDRRSSFPRMRAT
jgi:hypothetical protein